MEQQAPAFAADSEAALQRVTESGALDELRRQALKALRDKVRQQLPRREQLGQGGWRAGKCGTLLQAPHPPAAS